MLKNWLSKKVKKVTGGVYEEVFKWLSYCGCFYSEKFFFLKNN